MPSGRAPQITELGPRLAGLLVPVLLVMAGCQQGSPNAKRCVWGPQNGPRVLERLPDPYRAERPPLPSPPVPTVAPAERPSPAKVWPDGWTPAGGLSARWECIVIHHSASDAGCMHEIDEWHRNKGWNCCGYHFVIGNGTDSGDGQIEVGPRWSEQAIGAHTRLFGAPSSHEGNYYNEHGVGICLVGNFDHRQPSARQMCALAVLLTFLVGECHIPPDRVYLHGELKHTDCPGRHFSRADLGWVAQIRNTAFAYPYRPQSVRRPSLVTHEMQ